MHALWSKVEITLGGTPICASSHHYGYNAYIETLTNYGSDVKNGQLRAAFWHKDQASAFDNITDVGNTGYAA